MRRGNSGKTSITGSTFSLSSCPPLRERREDIPQLVADLLKKYSRGMDMRMEQESMSYLIQRNWKGNVRELENTIARACILSDYKVIKLSHLQDPCEERNDVSPSFPADAVGSVKDMEMKLILDALKSMNGNRTRAATRLGNNGEDTQKQDKRV